ncbi:MAG: VWA domain-containing protein [Bryobacterales bacterium]|nr:VWA domain-containing protein [Bryobacteraceae bacterium]MDW8354267.1 VWA domain-containing protein [Bryobacterales bacterium]
MRGCVVSILLTALAAASGQEQPPAPKSSGQERPPAFRAQVNEVVVPVTVTDEKGRFVSNLEASDFKIFDEEKEQKILYFSREHNQPVVIGFLLDMSNATRLHWKTFQEAALELVFTLLPGDKRFRGYLITYANEPELLVDTTHDSEPIADKIRKLKPGGGAAFFDAIYMACTRRSLVEGEPIEPRRVLVVIGDGHDTASTRSLEEVLEIAQRNLVTIYGISTVAFGFGSEGDKNLRRLAEETGGRVEYPLENLYKDVAGFLSTPSDEGNYALKVGTGQYAAKIAKGLFNAVAAIAGEVTTQYILRYVPSETDVPRTFRNIRVEVNLPNVTVRTRKGYYPYAP